jgi:Fe-S-cluster containining protein
VAYAYDDLRAKVEVTGAEIAARRRADLQCKRGCSLCCHVQLQLTPVETDSVRLALRVLAPDVRERIRARARALRSGAGPPRADAPCAMLEPDGSCAIYADRPIACRLAGHALVYPRGNLAQAAVRAKARNGEITWCELNYTRAHPRSEDVIQAGFVQTALANVNTRAQRPPSKVRSMVSLALEELPGRTAQRAP